MTKDEYKTQMREYRVALAIYYAQWFCAIVLCVSLLGLIIDVTWEVLG